jgi:hypothetical protein
MGRARRIAVGDVLAIRQTFLGGHMVALVVDVSDHDLLVRRNIKETQQFVGAEESVDRDQIRETVHAERDGQRLELDPLWAAVDLWVADRDAPLQGARPKPSALSWRLDRGQLPKESPGGSVS